MARVSQMATVGVIKITIMNTEIEIDERKEAWIKALSLFESNAGLDLERVFEQSGRIRVTEISEGLASIEILDDNEQLQEQEIDLS